MHFFNDKIIKHMIHYNTVSVQRYGRNRKQSELIAGFKKAFKRNSRVFNKQLIKLN